MSLNVSVGLCRKVGETDYGSHGTSIKVEIDSSLVSNSSELQEHIRQLFGIAHASLAENVNKGQGGTEKSNEANARSEPDSNRNNREEE